MLLGTMTISIVVVSLYNVLPSESLASPSELLSLFTTLDLDGNGYLDHDEITKGAPCPTPLRPALASAPFTRALFKSSWGCCVDIAPLVAWSVGWPPG